MNRSSLAATIRQTLRPSIVQRRIRIATALLCAIVIFLALFANLPFLTKRTALVTAETTFARITFDENTDWKFFHPAMICSPPSDLRKALGNTASDCGQFEESGAASFVNFKQGDSVEIRMEQNDWVIFHFPGKRGTGQVASEDGSQISASDLEGSLVKLSLAHFAKTGPLPLSGTITIGKVLGTGGAPDLLVGGTYEVRERSLIAQFFSRNSTTVSIGDLIPGTEVNLLEAERVAETSRGQLHLLNSDASSYQTLLVVGLTTGDRGALSMDVFGAEPVIVDPDWIDSIVADPIFFAVAFLLGLALNAVELILPLAGRSKEETLSEAEPKK